MRTLSGREVRWSTVFGAVLVMRLLYPFFNSPLQHLFSDAQRHWETGLHFLHPDVMGSGDPYSYQLWLFLLQRLAGDSSAMILTGCGVLCAAMPYGWYRTLRELMPRLPALRGAVLIGLWPPFLGLYGFFMTETLLLTLTGFCFALTLRALRKRSGPAFALMCALWLIASFTRVVALPLALVCVLCAWVVQPRKPVAGSVALLLVAAIAIPAGLHTRAALGYFGPLGNLYLNEIYHASGNKDIQIDYAGQGVYTFGSPSYYNPTFYPFSDWTTSRRGVYAITIDTRNGRADWQRAQRQLPHLPFSARLRDFGENLCYLFFGQDWPDNDRGTLLGAAAVWLRWLLLPIMIWTAFAALRGMYRGREWLVPACALMSLLLLAVQREGIMEGRYRKPLEPLLLTSIVLALRSHSRERDSR
jgi:hypothetical protein